VALKSELMSLGMPAAQAQRLGFDPPANFVSAGSTKANATLLTANHAIVTTTGSGQGVILGDPFQMWFVQNSDGSNAIKVYPPAGNNFSGIAADTAISVPTSKSLFVDPGGPSGLTWDVSN